MEAAGLKISYCRTCLYVIHLPTCESQILVEKYGVLSMQLKPAYVGAAVVKKLGDPA